MQITALTLILLLFGHDVVHGLVPDLPGWALVLSVLLPKAALSWIDAVVARRTERRLGKPDAQRAMRRLHMWGSAQRGLLLVSFTCDLAYGALHAVRETIGDWVLLDELIVLSPTLAVMVLQWWLSYPIERRLHEATLIRKLDEGQPFHRMPTRRRHVLDQARVQWGVTLIPLLVLAGWMEAVYLFGPEDWQAALSLGGTAGLFILSPLLVRVLWDTQPLPPGEVRDTMQGLCEAQRVRVRELLVWKTSGQLINAAVLGPWRGLRYILLTDGLLERVHREHLEAVMAHEMGHIRRHHLVQLVIATVGGLGALQWALSALSVHALNLPPTGAREAGVWTLAVGLWFIWFGVVSRAIERQADTFAVVHLNQHEDTDQTDRIQARAAETMIGALQRVADLNHLPTERRSWRHGSIASRQAYLRELVGLSVDALPIDVRVKQLRWLGLALLGVAIVGNSLLAS